MHFIYFKWKFKEEQVVCGGSMAGPGLEKFKFRSLLSYDIFQPGKNTKTPGVESKANEGSALSRGQTAR